MVFKYDSSISNCTIVFLRKTIDMSFNYGEDHLTAGKALAILSGKLKTNITTSVKQKINASHKAVTDIANGHKAIYGINTGFGPLCNTIISKQNTSKLQNNILLSHAVGVGDPVPSEIAKLMLILKMHALCQGYSGVSMTIINRIAWHISNDIIPVVPSQGSLGASGDLAPLSHLFLPLVGEGEVIYKGKKYHGKSILLKLKKKPIKLPPKSGLALINGTQFIAAHAIYVLHTMHNCLSHADIIGAMMIEGMEGSAAPFSKKFHQLRPYRGNRHVAERISSFLKDSAILESHKDCDKVQDPYSLRCMPQVHGASRTAWAHLKECVEIEINAVTDNPIIFSKRQTVSGGHFHGQPLAIPIDYACIAAAELGNISDRRTYLSLEGKHGLTPILLVEKTGLNSGFMILQYTTAALVSENKGLCFPASADSIPSSLGQEDHVSMGSIGSRKALKVCQNLEKILAIELICAAQALDFRRPKKSSKTLEAIHKQIRKYIKHTEEDRPFKKDIDAAIELVRQGKLVALAKKHQSRKYTFESEFELY